MKFTQTEMKSLFGKWAEIMIQKRSYLIDLDSVVGDSDLGLTMSEGFAAASGTVKALDEPDLGKLVYAAGKAMSTAVPSTMGTLIASGFIQAGKVLRGQESLETRGMAAFFSAFFDGIQNRGHAQPGEKTVLDGLTGFIALLKDAAEEDQPLEAIVDQMEIVAQDDLESTRTMIAKHGRAATRGEASRSLLDPGAAVAHLLITGFAAFIREHADT